MLWYSNGTDKNNINPLKSITIGPQKRKFACYYQQQESTHTDQTSATGYILLRNVKAVHDIENQAHY